MKKLHKINMNLYKKNLKKLLNSHSYYPSLEHDACGVGFVASTEGKKSRKVVEFGIQSCLASRGSGCRWKNR